MILLDINMPAMGGIAACQELRALSGAAIIALSVKGSELDKITGLDARADFSARQVIAHRRDPADPEYIITECWIGDRFVLPAAL